MNTSHLKRMDMLGKMGLQIQISLKKLQDKHSESSFVPATAMVRPLRFAFDSVPIVFNSLVTALACRFLPTYCTC